MTGEAPTKIHSRNSVAYLDPKRSTSSSSSAAAAAGAAPPPRENPELALGNCFIPVPKDLMWLYLKADKEVFI